MSSWYPPPAKPRAVDGGIKARSKRGAIAQTWWSERFIAVLESIGVGGRLARGRSYARKGQVVDLRVDAGSVTAAVQGSRRRPYRVRIGLTAFGKAEWAEVCEALAQNAWYTAKLLAGEMPTDIEEVFAALGLSLFPADPSELSMDCSCPDWEVPCKHLAAVFYLLAEDFDDDPFAILAWRGRERQALLDTLGALRAGSSGGRSSATGRDDELPDAAVPLVDCLDSYFVASGDLAGRTADPVPEASAALLDQLPAVDLAVRGASLVDLLRPVYRALGSSDPAE